MNRKELEQIAQQGESETVEFKKSTAQVRRAMETLCGMLNGHGGRVLFGITPQGQIVGQTVTDKTL
ncbi:MAG: ATP-binding protein, partial [Rubrobacteraceae bacterium]|nr:ATP-binding protein [Rubrobacteraceae bacterium]